MTAFGLDASREVFGESVIESLAVNDVFDISIDVEVVVDLNDIHLATALFEINAIEAVSYAGGRPLGGLDTRRRDLRKRDTIRVANVFSTLKPAGVACRVLRLKAVEARDPGAQ